MSGDEDNMQDQIPTQSVRLRSSNSWIGPPWIRIALWAPIAATAVVSSKKLFEQQNYHYPHRLLAFQEIVALAILLVRYFAPQRLFITPQKRSGPSSFHFGRCQNLFQYSQIRLIPVAALLGASYLCYMQAILHLPNLVTLLMITTLLSPTESLFLFVLNLKRVPKDVAIKAVFAVLVCAIVLYDDYRLTVNGLFFAIAALICVRLSRAYCVSGRGRNVPLAEGKSLSSWSQIVVLAMLLNLFTLAIYSYVFDVSAISFSAVSSGFSNTFALNIGTGALALVLSGSLEMPPEDVDESFDGIESDQPPLMYLSSDFSRSGLAAGLSTLLYQRGYVTWVQITAYFLGVSVLGINRILPNISKKLMTSSTREAIEPWHYLTTTSQPQMNSTEGRDMAPQEIYEVSRRHGAVGKETRSSMQAHLNSILLIILGLVSWVIYLRTNFGSSPSDDTGLFRPSLDTDYEASSQFDIVISMYKESTASVSSMISRITQLGAIPTSSIRVFVYAKDEKADTALLQQALGAFKVIKVPNEGRESETYLRHIVDTWDSLAKHNLFIQADIHNPREFYPRIRDYFRPNTGMLSLGFSGNVCDCRDCRDRWGWSDKSGVILDVYQEANKVSCGSMLLSYKGQFIVSAKRIRGVKRELYKDLQQALVNADSWAHQQKYLQGRPDSLNAPYFGFTMERLWSALFQCSDMDIAWKCPTLLSGTRRGGNASDCQCFDEVTPS